MTTTVAHTPVPAKPQVTPAQQRAIEAREGDVCVSAGAGSGKTFVLVERFMGLVREDEIHPERLLTITFTEKAAREMTDRIGRALEAEGYPHARRVVESAWISTIHGFCARLLRERALEAGVDPGFTVLTNVPAARVRREAFLRAQRSFRAEHPGTYDALVERVRWGRNQDGASGIRKRVFQLYDEVRAAGATLRELPLDMAFDALALPQVRVAFERLAEAVRWLLSAIAAQPRPSGFQQRRAAKVHELATHISAAPLDVFRTELHRDLRALAKASGGGGAVRTELRALRDAAERAAAVYADGPARALGRGLEDLLLRFDREFRALKAEQSALDFTDLEERARDLLESRPDVRDDVRRRFLAVLVDEFQDTSRLQQQLVDLVRRPGGLFVVGDVKQSIYGFRHADVQGLLGMERETRDAGGTSVSLDDSFRTRPEILAYVDEVFESVWGEPGSEVPPQSLQAGVPFPPVERPCLELIVGRGDNLRRARAHEARAVAARIATLIEGGLLRGTNPLRTDTYGQALRYRDCAILVPATTALKHYERALRERGVPYRVASGRGFYHVREVIDAVTLLKVTANAHDDLALLTLLRSPAVGISDAGLLALGGLREALAARPGAPRSLSLFTALREAVSGARSPFDARDLKLGLDAHRLIEALRALRGRTSTRELLAQGIEQSGLLDGSLLRQGDVRGFANLQKLLAVVEDLEREGVTGPGTIAAVLEDLRASDARESEANVASDDQDAVSILTVHGSKGLEWPLVVVADLGRYRRPGNDPVLWSADDGVTLNLRDPDDAGAAITPAGLLDLSDRRRAQSREESKRLLYVALTRARDHLILAGAQSFRARSSGDWLAWARAPLDMRQHLGVEQDLAAGGLARAHTTSGGVVFRYLEIQEDLDGTPVQGPCGPTAGAQPVLDAPQCHALAQGHVPRLPTPLPQVTEQAGELLDRLAAACLPPLDHGASVYTVSEVLTWAACPRQALYQYVIGDTQPWQEQQPGGWGTEELPADVRGIVAHEVLARFLSGSRPTLRSVTSRLAQLAPGQWPEEVLDRAARRALELGRTFLGSRLGRKAHGDPDTRAEFPFLVALELEGEPAPLLLRGTVDLLVPGEDGWVLADYKASEITALEVPSRLDRHELQLQLYALALSELGIPIQSGLVVYLAPEVLSRVDLSPQALAATRSLLTEFVRARRDLDLPPQPGSACAYCPWQASCPESRPPQIASPPQLDLSLAEAI